MYLNAVKWRGLLGYRIINCFVMRNIIRHIINQMELKTNNSVVIILLVHTISHSVYLSHKVSSVRKRVTAWSILAVSESVLKFRTVDFSPSALKSWLEHWKAYQGSALAGPWIRPKIKKCVSGYQTVRNFLLPTLKFFYFFFFLDFPVRPYCFPINHI